MKATLNERSNLISWLLQSEWIKKEYSDDPGWWWDKLANITSAQKKFINALLIQKNKEKLFEVLNNIVK